MKLDTSSKKLPIGVYQIDRWAYPEQTCMDIADIIIFECNRERKPEERFKPQKLLREDFGDYKLKIFHAINIGPPKWRSFFLNIVAPKEDIFKSINSQASYIAFIEHSGMLFGISGGQGNFVLERYAVQNFGMEILVRLIDKNNKVIKSIKDRGVTGNILGQIKVFRGEQKFSDEDQFGKVYKQVDAELNYKILKEVFGFSNKEIKKDVTGCLAKDSFKLNKSITFEKLLNVVSKLTSLFTCKDANFPINKVHQVSKRTNSGKDLIKKLEDQFVLSLYKSFLENLLNEFDFTYKDFEKYRNAALFTINEINGKQLLESSSCFTIDNLLLEFARNDLLISEDVDLFKNSFLKRFIYSYDENGYKQTSDTIFNHFHGEITFENTVYFRIDGDWYRIQSEFIKDLNKECENTLSQIWDDSILSEPFLVKSKETEGDYNLKYAGKKGYFVFDTIINESIEFCDILYEMPDSVNIIHVKKGFNNSLRDLTNQIAISARRFAEDRNSNYGFVNKIQEQTKRKLGSKSKNGKVLGSQVFPADGIQSIFSKKKDAQIFFCLAFVNSYNNLALKGNVSKFKSSIAKYCILELRKYIQSLNFSFKVVQIECD